jgi:hypothetical protein
MIMRPRTLPFVVVLGIGLPSDGLLDPACSGGLRWRYAPVCSSGPSQRNTALLIFVSTGTSSVQQETPTGGAAEQRTHNPKERPQGAWNGANSGVKVPTIEANTARCPHGAKLRASRARRPSVDRRDVRRRRAQEGTGRRPGCGELGRRDGGWETPRRAGKVVALGPSEAVNDERQRSRSWLGGLTWAVSTRDGGDGSSEVETPHDSCRPGAKVNSLRQM